MHCEKHGEQPTFCRFCDIDTIEENNNNDGNNDNGNGRQRINEELPDSVDFCSLKNVIYAPIDVNSIKEAVDIAIGIQKKNIDKNNALLKQRPGPARVAAIASQKARVSRRLLLAMRSTQITVVCPISGIVSLMDLPVIPGAALELEHPLSILGNARGIAQQGLSYLRKLDTQVLAGIFIVLAEHYNLIKFQPFDSGAQKNAILRTAGKDALIAAIIMVEDTVHSGNFHFLPMLSLVFDSELAEHGVSIRFQNYLMLLSEAIAKPDTAIYDDKAKPKKIGRPLYIKDVIKQENKISYLARQEIAKAKLEFREDKKIIKTTVLSLYAEGKIKANMKNFFMAIISDDSLLTIPEESLGLILMRISGIEEMATIVNIIKKDRSILTLDISEIEEMFSVEPKAGLASSLPEESPPEEESFFESDDPDSEDSDSKDSDFDEDDNEEDDCDISDKKRWERQTRIAEANEAADERRAIEIENREETSLASMPANLSWIEQVLWKKQHVTQKKRIFIQTNMPSIAVYKPVHELKLREGE